MPESGRSDPYDRGHVVWHDGLFRAGGRPWLVVSDANHPFHGEEYIVAGLTTTGRSGAVRLHTDDWVVGGLPKTSFVSPWFLTTLKHLEIDRGVGMIDEAVLERIVDRIVGYLGARTA